MLLLLALGIGIYLGLRFNVLVLAPFCAFGAGAYIAVALWAGQSVLASAGELILPFVVIQIGYFAGLLGRESLAMVIARLNPRPTKRV